MIMATATTQLFPWKDAYSVNVDIVDSQHKVLVDLINELHQAMMARSGKEKMGSILSKLVKYTQSHFKAEEGILQSNQYPDLANHQAEHNRFTQTIMDFQAKFERNEVGLTIELMEFLKDWLIKHIMGVDKKYAAHLNARGVR
jgi:hemerythrin